MFSVKLKAMRKQARMSQEQLAEKLHVSRQAVTKWETGIGVPDIENLKALSVLFHTCIDELLENQIASNTEKDFLYDSVTEYDIDRLKNYDISLPGTKQIRLAGYQGEKIQVRLASDLIPDIQSVFKTKIDDVKKKIDINVTHTGDITESRAKESLYVFIRFPLQYVRIVEIAGNTETLELKDLKAEHIDFSGKTSRVVMDGVSGHIEIDCNQDMDVVCRSLNGRIDVNQISAASRISLPAGVPFIAATKGIGNTILYEADGKSTDDFSLKGEAVASCENMIELNGMKSELIISAVSAQEVQ